MLTSTETAIGIGSQGELLARTHLENKGLIFVEQNYRCKLGEIDLIMMHNDILVFTEVKTRKNNRFGAPLQFINTAKQQKIQNTAQYYLQQKKLSAKQHIRFDAVGITTDGDKPQIEWVENAF